MTHSADVVVVGGGMVGAACAYELARDGHTVTLVDRHEWDAPPTPVPGSCRRRPTAGP